MGVVLLNIIVESRVLQPRTNCGLFLHTNLAGFSDIMTIATIDIHYGI